MAKFRGNVILADVVDQQEANSSEFQEALTHWAAVHGGHWTLDTMYARGWLSVGARALGCVVDQSEMDSDGFFHVGPYKAYLGSYTLVDVESIPPKEVRRGFNFPEEITRFFDNMHFSEADRNKVLDMPMRDFLQICKAAAETSMESALAAEVAENPITEDPEPQPPHKMVVLAGKATCPSCHNAKLRIVDGIVGCPLCDYIAGDIDKLP